ncbi:hypothetical protein TVAG_124460, partial [Trichomonas vaginalis G3]
MQPPKFLHSPNNKPSPHSKPDATTQISSEHISSTLSPTQNPMQPPKFLQSTYPAHSLPLKTRCNHPNFFRAHIQHTLSHSKPDATTQISSEHISSTLSPTQNPMQPPKFLQSTYPAHSLPLKTRCNHPNFFRAHIQHTLSHSKPDATTQISSEHISSTLSPTQNPMQPPKFLQSTYPAHSLPLKTRCNHPNFFRAHIQHTLSHSKPDATTQISSEHISSTLSPTQNPMQPPKFLQSTYPAHSLPLKTRCNHPNFFRAHIQHTLSHSKPDATTQISSEHISSTLSPTQNPMQPPKFLQSTYPAHSLPLKTRCNHPNFFRAHIQHTLSHSKPDATTQISSEHISSTLSPTQNPMQPP